MNFTHYTDIDERTSHTHVNLNPVKMCMANKHDPKARRNPLYELITHGFVLLTLALALALRHKWTLNSNETFHLRIWIQLEMMSHASVTNWNDRALLLSRGGGEEEEWLWIGLMHKCLYWAAHKHNQHSAFLFLSLFPAMTLPFTVYIYWNECRKWRKEEKTDYRANYVYLWIYYFTVSLQIEREKEIERKSKRERDTHYYTLCT